MPGSVRIWVRVHKEENSRWWLLSCNHLTVQSKQVKTLEVIHG